MRLQFRMYGEPNDRFAPEAAAGMIGKVVPVNIIGQAQPCDGEVVEAEVVDDGQALLVTVEAEIRAAKAEKEAGQLRHRLDDLKALISRELDEVPEW